MRKECLNYKDKIILEQNGRWYNLYVDGSLIHANMDNKEAIKVYFSYVKVLKRLKRRNKRLTERVYH